MSEKQIVPIYSLIVDQGIDAYMEFCKQNPDALPVAVERYENAMSYAVGFWWLSLDDRTKTAQLEKHPVFAEKHSYQTCMTYGTVCKKIPTSIRMEVVQNVIMGVSQKITDAFSDPSDLEFWFNLAINLPISARNIEMLIQAKKSNPEIMPFVLGELPYKVTGKRADKANLEKLIESARQQIKPVEVIVEKPVEVVKEVIIEKPVEKPGQIILSQSELTRMTETINQLEKDKKSLEARLKSVESQTDTLLSSKEKDLTNQIKLLQKEVKDLKTLKKDPDNLDLIQALQDQLSSKEKEIESIKADLRSIQDPANKSDYQGFSPYEVLLAEKVLSGQTVVAAMHSLKNPYGSPFLQWVQKMGLGVKIDRSTEWGNPYTDQDGDLEFRMISFMDYYFPRKLSLVKKTAELKGKVLLCWCKKDRDGKNTAVNQACHGDILADYANEVRK